VISGRCGASQSAEVRDERLDIVFCHRLHRSVSKTSEAHGRKGHQLPHHVLVIAPGRFLTLLAVSLDECLAKASKETPCSSAVGPCEVPRAGEERQGRPRRPCGPIGIGDPMVAARRPDVLAQQLPGEREQADMEHGPLHLDALADPAGRCRVVGGVHFDAPIEMDGPQAVAVIPKRFEGQRLQRRSLLRKHRGDLALSGAVDDRTGLEIDGVLGLHRKREKTYPQ
jgi:hypothetical protein